MSKAHEPKDEPKAKKSAHEIHEVPASGTSKGSSFHVVKHGKVVGHFADADSAKAHVEELEKE
jgi:hypothetical protein